MRRVTFPILLTVAVTAALVAPLAHPRAATAATFTDTASSAFTAEIDWLVARSITAGCGSTRFCPGGSVTREQMASFVRRATNIPTVSSAWFTDVASSSHRGDINGMAAAKITAGCTATRFCPTMNVTRGQMASFLARALGLRPASGDYFHDDNGTTHEGSINRLAAAGITGGCAAGRYCPNATVTREQMAGFLYRAFGGGGRAAPRTTLASGNGVWISVAEIAARPMSGDGWKALLSAASQATRTGANVADQDSDHDVATLAAAIVAVRTALPGDRARAVAALEGAVGTERGARWLAIGRNLASYVIAADLLGVRSGPVHTWLVSFQTMKLAHNTNGSPVTMRQSAWSSGSNASAQEGFAHAALAAYLGDASELAWSWDGFRRYAGDRTSPHNIRSNDDSWQQVPLDPVGIQNAGASSSGIRLDGAISNDMSRGGALADPPGYTSYPWVGLEGAVPAAVILARAGFPSWDVASEALRRAAEYLHGLRVSTGNPDWYDDRRAAYVKHLLNRAYGLSYPARLPAGIGRTTGFTDWTHPTLASVAR